MLKFVTITTLSILIPMSALAGSRCSMFFSELRSERISFSERRIDPDKALSNEGLPRTTEGARGWIQRLINGNAWRTHLSESKVANWSRQGRELPSALISSVLLAFEYHRLGIQTDFSSRESLIHWLTRHFIETEEGSFKELLMEVNLDLPNEAWQQFDRQNLSNWKRRKSVPSQLIDGFIMAYIGIQERNRSLGIADKSQKPVSFLQETKRPHPSEVKLAQEITASPRTVEEAQFWILEILDEKNWKGYIGEVKVSNWRRHTRQTPKGLVASVLLALEYQRMGIQIDFTTREELYDWLYEHFLSSEEGNFRELISRNNFTTPREVWQEFSSVNIANWKRRDRIPAQIVDGFILAYLGTQN